MDIKLLLHPNKVKTPCGKKSMTDQQYKDECDINAIVDRFVNRGVPPPVVSGGVFADVSNIGDFAEHMRVVNEGKQHFAELPSSIRNRFGNDPSAYFDFVMNPKNVEEMVRLGIAKFVPKMETAVDVLKQIKDKVSPEKGAKPSGEAVADV